MPIEPATSEQDLQRRYWRLAAVLFVRSFWPVLREVIALPEKAVTGEPAVARQIAGVTLRKIGRELLSVLLLIVTFIAVTLLSGVMLSLVVEPTMEAVIAFLYPQVDPDAASGLGLAATVHRDRYQEGDLADTIDGYDRRRAALRPYARQRSPQRWGEAAFYGWSEDKARQYAEPLRADFGAFVRAQGFRLE